MSLYEAHITIINPGDDEFITNIHGWKFSKIDGDPVLGPGVKAYLTSYHNDGMELLLRMHEISGSILSRGYIVIREKIEQIVYDTKTGANELSG